MTTNQINTELKNTKEIMNSLLACVKAGQKEFYNDYLQVSAYYLKLSQVKPNHNLTIV
jgi:hypothetical protein